MESLCSCTVGKMENGIVTVENSSKISQKFKTLYDPTTPVLCICPKQLKTVLQRDACTHYSQQLRGGNNLSVHQWPNG